MTNKWTDIPSDSIIAETAKNLTANGMKTTIVESKEDALELIKKIIPKGAEINNGSSTSLHEIGFTDLLKSEEHGWNNIHGEILKETDWIKQSELRRKAVTSDFFLGSANAISKTGAIIAADATGSRIGAYPFAAKKLIIVASANKIVDTIDEAFDRIRQYVFDLENARAQEAYGMGSTMAKWLIIEKEVNPERIEVILVKEKLGF